MASIPSLISPTRSPRSSTATQTAASTISCHGASPRRQASSHRGSARRLRTIKKALSAVMDASPAMFKVFVAAEIVATPAGGSRSLERIGEDRMLLAIWVGMLEATERALDASVAAAASGDAPTMGEALAATQTLATIADDLRRILAGSGE